MCSFLNRGLFILILSSINFMLTEAVQCYGCHGEYCNDPFNKDRATIVNCSYSSRLTSRSVEDVASGTEISNAKFKDWQSLENKLLGIFFNNQNTEYVCVKSAYFNKVHQTNMSIRRCMPKTYKNTDACGQLSTIVNGGYGTIQSCMSCDTNLCNSANASRKGTLALLVLIFVKSLI